MPETPDYQSLSVPELHARIAKADRELGIRRMIQHWRRDPVDLAAARATANPSEAMAEALARFDAQEA